MSHNGTIIWDWNGTLLNDVDICLECINSLLAKRRHPELNREKYVQIFTFPVRDYYVKAGFDFTHESFDKIAIEFIQAYHQKLPDANIFPDVTGVLQTFQKNNFLQVIVSAMEHQSLVKSVEEKGIEEYFEII